MHVDAPEATRFTSKTYMMDYLVSNKNVSGTCEIITLETFTVDESEPIGVTDVMLDEYYKKRNGKNVTVLNKKFRNKFKL
jgi:hypothetical protein